MICRIYDVPGATLEQYDRVDERVGPDKPRGVHAHIAGATAGGVRIIEVWDSAEDIERYMAAGLGEALEAMEFPEPTITEFEVHALDWLG